VIGSAFISVHDLLFVVWFTGGVGGDCEDAYYSFVERWQDVLYANMTSEELAGLGIDESTWSYGLEHARLNMLTRVCVFVDCVVLYQLVSQHDFSISLLLFGYPEACYCVVCGKVILLL
jgi:hypothetical protein